MMLPICQRISVPFDYDVHFTTGLFRSDNLLLASILEPAPKALCVLDGGVADLNPSLALRIEDYCRSHHLNLVCSPMTVPGGEQVKNTRE